MRNTNALLLLLIAALIILGGILIYATANRDDDTAPDQNETIEIASPSLLPDTGGTSPAATRTPTPTATDNNFDDTENDFSPSPVFNITP